MKTASELAQEAVLWIAAIILVSVLIGFVF
jgi:hypothetical protein